MDHNRAPLLEALASYHRDDRYGFSPPGHRQGRGADPRVLEVLGREPFRADVLASGGLDDWCSRGRFLADAEQLMADAVGAEAAFFSTCGSSLSVRAAMMAVAGNSDGGLLVPRDSHKSIVGGLIFSGIQPRWILPCWDEVRHFSHPPSRPPLVRLPSPDELQLETVTLPRDAFFGATELVAARDAAGRVAAEQITPYPPGIPAVIPGERINDAVIDYLRSGLHAGMALPDATDPRLDHLRVVCR